MKPRYSVLALLLSLVFTHHAQAQIPNAGFEDWNGNQPSGWVVANEGSLVTTVKQTSDAHSGNLALFGQVVNLGTKIPPAGITGSINGLDTIKGFPFTSRPTAFTGYYKFAPFSNSGDELQIYVAFKKNGVGIGAATFLTSTAQGSYTQFSVTPQWSSNDNPDSAYIVFLLKNPAGMNALNQASNFTLDDLGFDSSVAGVSNNSVAPTFGLSPNYPNPVDGRTTISFSLKQAGFASLDLYNVTGGHVATLAQGELLAGEHTLALSASDFPAGIYFYRLSSGSETATRQLQIIK